MKLLWTVLFASLFINAFGQTESYNHNKFKQLEEELPTLVSARKLVRMALVD